MGVKRALAPIGRLFGRLWWFLDGTRRVVFTLLFWLIVIGLVWAATRGGKPLQEKTTLVLDIRGDVVEQFSGSPRDQAIAQIKGEDRAQTRLRDILRAIDAAAKDDKIVQVLLELDQMGSATPAALHEIEAALTRFKASKKPVVAFGQAFDQRAYYLAAQATEVYVHPMGGVMIEGYGRYRNYYKDALDRLGIAPNVMRVGTYKNAVEPYFANGPSKATLEAEGYLYDELWTRYQASVEAARKLPKGAIQRAIDELPQRLQAVGGDPGKFVLAEKLVDGLKTQDQVEALLEKRGAKDEKHLRRIGLGAYVAQLSPTLPKPEGQVGVIVAEGEIVDGNAGPGRIGGDSMSKLIRQAREDDKVKAIVLRVNSPGGSAFASELVRRELELTRAVGKPVVVSMGGVAASGGYWISMSSDEVIADPSTITGSIGVFGMLPTAEKLMDKLSIHTGGYTTTWLASGYDPRRPLDPRLAQVVQSSIEHIYADFTGKAAQARKKTQPQIDAVGQGRVWTGAQALERGLVDRNGLLQDAIASAAKRAGRATTEGRVLERVTDDGAKGTLVAVGCETEPVSKNEDFLAFVERALETCRDLGHDVEEASPELERAALARAWIAIVAANLSAEVTRAERAAGRPAASDDLEPLTGLVREIGRKGVSGADFVGHEFVVQQAGLAVARFHERYDVWITSSVGRPPALVGDISALRNKGPGVRVAERTDATCHLRHLVKGRLSLPAGCEQLVHDPVGTAQCTIGGWIVGDGGRDPLRSVPLHDQIFDLANSHSRIPPDCCRGRCECRALLTVKRCGNHARLRFFIDGCLEFRYGGEHGQHGSVLLFQAGTCAGNDLRMVLSFCKMLLFGEALHSFE